MNLTIQYGSYLVPGWINSRGIRFTKCLLFHWGGHHDDDREYAILWLFQDSGQYYAWADASDGRGAGVVASSGIYEHVERDAFLWMLNNCPLT